MGMNFVTCVDLRRVFPEYAERIEQVSNTNACGCAGCVSAVLKGEVGSNLLEVLLKLEEYKGCAASSLIA